MFRPMRRFKQQVSQEECIRVLRTVPRGVLSVLGDEEYLAKEIKNAFPRVCCLELTVEHMTGKLVNESYLI